MFYILSLNSLFFFLSRSRFSSVSVLLIFNPSLIVPAPFVPILLSVHLVYLIVLHFISFFFCYSSDSVKWVHYLSSTPHQYFLLLHLQLYYLFISIISLYLFIFLCFFFLSFFLSFSLSFFLSPLRFRYVSLVLIFNASPIVLTPEFPILLFVHLNHLSLFHFIYSYYFFLSPHRFNFLSAVLIFNASPNFCAPSSPILLSVHLIYLASFHYLSLSTLFCCLSPLRSNWVSEPLIFNASPNFVAPSSPILSSDHFVHRMFSHFLLFLYIYIYPIQVQLSECSI